MGNKRDVFEYTYSASQQEEIEKIKQKYTPKETDKMEQIRELDRKVEQTSTMFGIFLGIAGCLVLGIGLCCVLVWSEQLFALGIAVGVVGIVLIIAAFPGYQYMVKKQKEKIAPQILELIKELEA